jgi:hypothetical protein
VPGPTPTAQPATVRFIDVSNALNNILAAWKAQNGVDPDLNVHGASFDLTTKAGLLAAVGKGYQLIQPSVINNGKGDQANIVIDLVTGMPAGGGHPARPRMPFGGPYFDLSSPEVQTIIAWINANCPD